MAWVPDVLKAVAVMGRSDSLVVTRGPLGRSWGQSAVQCSSSVQYQQVPDMEEACRPASEEDGGPGGAPAAAHYRLAQTLTGQDGPLYSTVQ